MVDTIDLNPDESKEANDFAFLLKEIKGEHSMSAFANIVGIARDRLSRIVNGHCLPSEEDLKKIAAYSSKYSLQELIEKREKYTKKGVRRLDIETGEDTFVLDKEAITRKMMLILKEIRGDRSIRDFAEEIGSSLSSVDRAEKGQFIPSDQTLYKISGHPNCKYTFEELVAIKRGIIKTIKPVPVIENIINYAKDMPEKEKMALIDELINSIEDVHRRRAFTKEVLPIVYHYL